MDTVRGRLEVQANWGDGYAGGEDRSPESKREVTCMLGAVGMRLGGCFVKKKELGM